MAVNKKDIIEGKILYAEYILWRYEGSSLQYSFLLLSMIMKMTG